MSILDTELAEQISDALAEADIPQDCVVTRSVLTDVNNTPWDPSDDVAVDTDYPCSGLTDSYSALELANSSIQSTDVKVLIVAATLSITPVPGDHVTISGTTYRVMTVATDPARALWECQCRI